MSIFDSHCHPQFPQYDKDREEVLGRAREAGVSLICVGTDIKTSKEGIELAQKYDGIWVSVGLHPNDIHESGIMNHESWQQLLAEPKVVAVGEVGLDYYRTSEPEKQEKQKEVFSQFLDLAIKHDKPIIIQSRDAQKGSTGRVHSDMLQILEGSRSKAQGPKLRGVAHSFTGTLDEAKKYLDMGFYLGFNGILTFTRQYDEVVRYVPLENILLETDAPYLAPEPYRGQRNEPLYVIEVAKKVAELKNEPLDRVIEQTTQNCKKLFKI